jgi:hypothetical protein
VRFDLRFDRRYAAPGGKEMIWAAIGIGAFCVLFVVIAVYDELKHPVGTEHNPKPREPAKELSWMEDGDLDMTQVKNPSAEMI